MAGPDDLPTADYRASTESTSDGLNESATVDFPGTPQAYKHQHSSIAVCPREIGNYVIISEIARGGMGVVYKAHQRGLNRIVALKMTLAGDFAGAEERQRFRLEAEAAGQLDHPAIVPIYEVSEHEGSPYFSMGLVEGQSLRGLLSEGPLPIRQAAEIARTVARAVHYAHTRGIVHRDLKPANILIDSQGQPRVTDFGLAKQVSTNSELTNTGQILGTPSFMPPEQAQGKIDQVGPLADVYSLGATLYCLLTGRPPFQAASLIDTLMQVVHQEPVPPRTLNNSIPRDAETICLKCLEKSPGQRYATADELANDLDRFLNNEPVQARPLGTLQRAWRWCQRKPAAAGLIAALSLMLGMLIIGFWFRWQYAATAERLAHAEALKKLSDYYAGISRAHELLSGRQAGAVWQAESEIAQIEHSVPNKNEQIHFDSLKAEIDSRYDLQLINSAMTNFRIGSLAFSPDGQRIAVGQRKHGAGFSVNIFETEALLRKNAKPLAPQTTFIVSTLANAFSKLLSGDDRYQDGARSLAWSPDGKWLVVGSRFGQLTRWNMSDQKAVGVTWSGGDKPVASLFFSADGSRLYSQSNQLREWDCAQGWIEIHQEAEPVDAVVTAPESDMLLTHLTKSDVIGLINKDTRNLVYAWPSAVNMRPMALSPDGRLVAGLGEDGVTIRLSSTGELFQTVAPTHEKLDFDPDSLRFLNGELLVAKDNLRRLHIWEVGSGRPVIQPIASADDGMVWSFDPISNRLWITDVASRDMLKVYQLRAPNNVRSLVPHGQARAVDFSGDGQQLAVVSTHRAAEDEPAWTELSKWSLQENKTPTFVRADHRVYSQLRPPFGAAWNGVTNNVAWFVGTDGILISQALHDGVTHKFLPAMGNKKSATLVDPIPQNANTAVDKVLHLKISEGAANVNASRATCVSWSLDGRYLWTFVNDRKELIVRNADGLEALGFWSNKHKDITTGLAAFASLTVGPEFVVCGGENGTVTVLPNKLPDSGDGMLEPVHEFLGPGGCVNTIAHGPASSGASSWVLIGTQTGNAQLRSLPSGEVLAEVQSEHGSVQSVAIGSTGKLIVTGGDDGVVRLMHVDSNWQVTPWLTLPFPYNAIEQVRLSTDEKFLAVVGRPAKHVLVWDISRLKATP